MAASSPAAAQMGPLPVDVASPLQATIVDWDEYTGRFEAVQRVELRARVSGYLQEIRFKDGQTVSKGDVLFVIDPRSFDAAVARAEAERQAAVAQQSLAAVELIRGEELKANRNLAITDSELDARRAQKLEADANVAIADAALVEARLNQEFTRITAPFNGRISDSLVDQGNLVTAGETPLARLVSIDPIHLVLTASEADFLKYARLNAAGSRQSSRNAANEVQAKLIDEADWSHFGEMDFVAAELDPNAGTITARAVFPNPDDFLTPGLFARLRVIGSGPYEAVLVPDAAILSDQARKIVMTVTPIADDDPLKEGCQGAPCAQVAPKVVVPGALYRGMRVIKSGLTAEDRVIVSGVQRARPGGAVIPQPVTLELSAPPIAGDAAAQ